MGNIRKNKLKNRALGVETAIKNSRSAFHFVLLGRGHRHADEDKYLLTCVYSDIMSMFSQPSLQIELTLQCCAVMSFIKSPYF